MKTLSATEARQNIGNWLSRALKGEDIGVVYKGKIVALRPVEVYGENYAMMEYGVTEQELKRFDKKMSKQLKDEKSTKWNGTAKGLRG